jgi:hypothetical protein
MLDSNILWRNKYEKMRALKRRPRRGERQKNAINIPNYQRQRTVSDGFSKNEKKQ